MYRDILSMLDVYTSSLFFQIYINSSIRAAVIYMFDGIYTCQLILLALYTQEKDFIAFVVGFKA